MSTTAELLALNKARKAQGYNSIDENNKPAVEAGFKHGVDNGYYKPETEVAPTPAPTEPTDQQYIDSRLGPGTYDKYSKIDPQQNVLEQIYKSSVKAPTPISEKGIENAQLASGIGEGLQTLGDIFGASRGAHTKERDFTNSPIAQQTANERNVRALYDQKESQYNSGLANAKIGDYSNNLQETQRRRNEMLHLLQNRDALKAKANEDALKLAQWKFEQSGKSAKDKRDYDLAVKKLNQDAANNKEQNAIKRKDSTERLNKTNADMDIVNRVRSLPAEWQKKMGFLKPVATEEMGMKKTEWTFDNSIKPEVLQAAVKQYESEQVAPAPQQQQQSFQLPGLKNNNDPLGLGLK